MHPNQSHVLWFKIKLVTTGQSQGTRDPNDLGIGQFALGKELLKLCL